MNPAYKHTVFQALPEELPVSFCIITAWNPDGKTDLPGRNRQRDQQLAERLDALTLSRVRIIGMSPDESHAEPGWALSCPVDQGLSLGREFRQEAIFHAEGGELSLINCESKTKSALGSFATRLRDPRSQRLFTVHVGAPSPRARFLSTEALEIRLRAAKRFSSFTITEAEAHHGSQNEDAILITVATDQPREVLGLAKDLRKLLYQDGIGISHNGIYQRVTAWSDPDFLLRAWGLTAVSD